MSISQPYVDFFPNTPDLKILGQHHYRPSEMAGKWQWRIRGLGVCVCVGGGGKGGPPILDRLILKIG